MRFLLSTRMSHLCLISNSKKEPNNNHRAMKQNILRPVTVQTAPAESRPTLATIQKAFGFVPNLMATFRELPYRPARLSCDGRRLGKRDLQPQSSAASSSWPRASPTVDYCTAAHSTILKAFLKAPAAVVNNIRSGKPVGDEHPPRRLSISTVLLPCARPSRIYV